MDSNLASSPVSLSSGSMIRSGVRHHWRTSIAVSLGVAIATSVIVGALLVGDSMRGSLRGLTVERLGRIESVIAPGGFFAVDRAPQTLGLPQEEFAAILLFDRAVLESSGENARRAGSVQAIGCDDAFWELDASGVAPTKMPDENSVILTETLAAELDVKVGDQVTVRLPVEQAVPADSPLGRRDVQTEGIPRLTVTEILPDRGLARFSLAPAQSSPKNIFLSRELISEVLQREGQANVVLAATEIDPQQLDVALPDLGLNLKRITKTFQAKDDDAEPVTIFDYFDVTSERLLLDDTTVKTIKDALPPQSVTPVMTYLANAIETVEGTAAGSVRSVPYSTLSAMDSSERFPLNFELPESESTPSDSQPDSQRIPIVLNSWTANQLQAQVGTPLRVAYFESEVENGKEIERFLDAVVTDIVPIVEPSRGYFRSRAAVFDQPPTIYNDPSLTPEVPGVTDQDSINDWDLPFKLTREINSQDDAYWKNHRLTPKAFIPLAHGQRLFGSRFGSTTSLRIDPSVAENEQELESTIVSATKPFLADLGWHPRSIRAKQLAASKGTTPFDGLFLSLSCFVIFSAIMLIAMLFRLGLVSRSRELGTLMALGLTGKQVSKMFLGEGIVIASIGVALGLAGGILYAKIVLMALKTFWVGAVTVPFLTFHASAFSLIGGAAIGLLIGVVTLWRTLRSMLQNSTVALLGGRDQSNDVQPGERNSKWPLRVAWILVIAAVGAGVGGALSGGQTAAGGFVGGGMLLLIAILVFVYDTLRTRRRSTRSLGGYSLTRLARSNATRSPLRSTLTIGLMATASFLIVAITAFQLKPSDEGTGGFDLVADSAQPLYEDLSDPEVQSGLLGRDAEKLSDATVVSFRVRSGQDASCNNLYQATEPTVFGVPARDAEALNGFRFYSQADTQDPKTSAWKLLEREAKGTPDDPIAMIVDQNTAMWSLQMMKGIGERKSFTYDNQTLHFEVVGLLENSLLQGRLLIGESSFEGIFPEINGYRFTMISSEATSGDEIEQVLENRLSDIGFDASDAAQVLSGMMAVQNTYLRTFQSLGGLGLLLGTIGLAIAQLRNVLERRNELAVMRAIGFSQSRLATMVMGETAALLLIGIGCGVFCAVLAVFPHAITRGIAPPVLEPILFVVGIILFGLIAGVIAAVKVVRMPLLGSLRGS